MRKYVPFHWPLEFQVVCRATVSNELSVSYWLMFLYLCTLWWVMLFNAALSLDIVPMRWGVLWYPFYLGNDYV